MWHVQALQIVWFTSVTEIPSAEKLFQIAYQSEADLVQRNRQLGAANRFLSVAESVIDDGKYAVQVQPGRVDFMITVDNSDVEFDAPIKSLSLELVHAKVQEVVERITGQIPSVHRVAHVGSYVLPVSDYQEAAKMHLEMTGIDFPPEDLSDLLFQVNKKTAGYGVYEINRLLRLGIAAEHGLLLSVGQAPEGVEAFAPKYGLSLVLDFNSVPSGMPINSDDQTSLFARLIDETKRLVAAQNPIKGLKQNA